MSDPKEEIKDQEVLDYAQEVAERFNGDPSKAYVMSVGAAVVLAGSSLGRTPEQVVQDVRYMLANDKTREPKDV